MYTAASSQLHLPLTHPRHAIAGDSTLGGTGSLLTLLPSLSLLE